MPIAVPSPVSSYSAPASLLIAYARTAPVSAMMPIQYTGFMIVLLCYCFSMHLWKTGKKAQNKSTP